MPIRIPKIISSGLLLLRTGITIKFDGNVNCDKGHSIFLRISLIKLAYKFQPIFEFSDALMSKG